MTLLMTLLLIQDPETLQAAAVDQGPVIDGDLSDAAWSKAPVLKLSAKKAMEPDEKGIPVTLRAVVSGDTVYVAVEWSDPSKDDAHKPWVWNAEKKAYEAGKQEEDICSLGFALEGEFNPNMLAKVNAKWDVWHWKAARTNPAGFAMDKTHQYSTTEFKGGKAFTGSAGKIWLARPEDAGKSATRKAEAPKDLQGETIPQFIAQEPEGSAADVRAKGVWKEGRWTLELSRKLKTGNADDRNFAPGEKVPFALAVFDHSEHEEHSVSEALQLALPK